MITEVLTSKGTAAITSDQWHVVLSRFTNARRSRPFSRCVDSEHPDRDGCRKAAKALRARMAAEAEGVPEAERSEVLVRPPHFKSLKAARRRRTKPR
jgi:hypothetical protein